EKMKGDKWSSLMGSDRVLATDMVEQLELTEPVDGRIIVSGNPGDRAASCSTFADELARAPVRA
ncbi:MAG TPA: hypothetical protein VGU26_09900, partial [Gaiellaceae bacterium]|nr:hypothetical protein [Gaiellaceae bacterium]